MIGVDTNVLLRLFVGDNEAQQAGAANLFSRRSTDEQVYICVTVLLEFIWSLKRTYGYSSENILELLDELLEVNDVVFERHDLIVGVLEKAKTARVGFPDLMVAMGNLSAGCSHTVTFDRGAAARIPGMELLS